MLLQKQSHSNKLGLQLLQTLPLNSEVFNWPDIRGTFSCFSYLFIASQILWEIRIARHPRLGVGPHAPQRPWHSVFPWLSHVFLRIGLVWFGHVGSKSKPQERSLCSDKGEKSVRATLFYCCQQTTNLTSSQQVKLCPLRSPLLRQA